MKNKFLWLGALLLCFLIFLLTGKQLFENKKDVLRIGIIQYDEHGALDASRNGFSDALKEMGFNGELIYKNAQADQSNCLSIVNQFVDENVDLILAIATPAAQCCARATTKIPILATSVTDFEGAGLTQPNVSGTSDLAPISKQIGLIKELKPEAKKVGILFSSSEANSKFQADIAMEEAKKIDLTPETFTFSQDAEIQQVVESMVEKVDVIYTPTDNAVARSMGVISKIATQNNVPVICGDVNLLSEGATGTFGLDYYELGKLTAKQAIQILNKEKNIEDIDIQYFEDSKLALNSELIKKLNLKEISP